MHCLSIFEPVRFHAANQSAIGSGGLFRRLNNRLRHGGRKQILKCASYRENGFKCSSLGISLLASVKISHMSIQPVWMAQLRHT